ncbi:transporter substrate-binding domain-containing protein [Pseudodesulfovibrio indicus]|uniref:substrate-binding periplasmic protein n=1 Tax=Pseudodesulfovibrio indicus TaxID=1716143 RepID=UPI00292CADCA|nr:transporter substrate-binding domain-containing protein [Pseudodesulfovibrio indicus]
MNWRMVFFLMVACLVGFGRASAAEDTLRLATVDNIPPYVFRENGALTGISIDVINELAERGGFKVRITTLPWARVILGLEEGSLDGAFSAYETEARKRFCLYSGRVHFDELGIAVRADRQFAYTGLESLYGKTVGKGRRVWVSEPFQHAAEMGRIRLVETDDMRMTNIKMLDAGRLDAVIGSPEAMLHYARRLNIAERIVVLPQRMREGIPAYLVLSRASPLEGKEEWQGRLTRLLDQMNGDGTIRAINRRYGVLGP